ncbi:hypothetical protein ABFT51_19215 [Paenibacillus peoriae]
MTSSNIVFNVVAGTSPTLVAEEALGGADSPDTFNQLSGRATCAMCLVH